MPSYPLRALVLRHTKLGETDVIVTLLGEDGSQVRAVAKGLRRPGSRIGGRLEEFSVVDVLLHSGRNLDVVSEVRSVDTHKRLRADFDRTAAAAVVVDLLDKISTEGQTEGRLYGLAETALGVFETAEIERLPSLVVAFLVKAMSMHGYRPQLEACASCCSEVAESHAFSLAAGGALCAACGSVDASALRFPAAARDWLALLLSKTMVEVAETEIPEGAVADCFVLMRSFIAFHVSARLKALDFYAGNLAF